MMDAITDPSNHTVVFYTSARVGKTSIIENAIGYFIEAEPCPILVVQPTEQDAMDWSKDSLTPMFRDTPSLTDRVTEAKAKSGDNTILHKKFPGGYLKAVGANSPRGFRRVTIRALFMDEVDGYPVSAGPEGDPVELAKKRTSTVWNSITVLTSTPTVKGISRIEFEWDRSDKRHYFVPCPKCGHYQILIFGPRSQFSELAKGFLKFDEKNPSEVVYVCESCHGDIRESEKYRMIARGEWRSTAPEVKGTAGYHLNELYSTFSSWGKIASDFIKAKNDREKLRTFINTSLGESFELEESYQVSNELLGARIEHWDPYRGQIPEGVLVLTSAVDVQKDRLEVQVDGWGIGEERWLIDHLTIPGMLSDAETRDVLDEYLLREWRRADGVRLNVSITFVDSGGDQTQDVYKFTKARFRRRVMSIKGVGGMGRPLVGKPTRANKENAIVIPIGVDDAKRIIYDRLDLKEVGPKFMHFSRVATDEYLKQLTSEEKVRVLEKGQPKLIWRLRRGQRRNEALDLTVYSLAALRSLNANMGRVAESLRKASEKIPGSPGDAVQAKQDDPPAQVKRFVRKSNFVTSWRKW
jgi:phage terminase large subunit GpA-like protein